ncbi:MAG: hypothetical protein ACRCRZ_00485 [Metamycoplasmataceae bacterium]
MNLTKALIKRYLISFRFTILIVILIILTITYLVFFLVRFNPIYLSAGDIILIVVMSLLILFPLWLIFLILKDFLILKKLKKSLNSKQLLIFSRLRNSEIRKMISKKNINISVFNEKKIDYNLFNNELSNWIKHIKENI